MPNPSTEKNTSGIILPIVSGVEGNNAWVQIVCKMCVCVRSCMVEMQVRDFDSSYHLRF